MAVPPHDNTPADAPQSSAWAVPPADPKVAHAQAMQAFERSDLATAEGMYSGLVAARPNDLAARFYLAQVLERTSRAGEALEHAEHAFRLAPRQPAIAAFVAHLRRLAGRLNDALDAQRAACALAPQDMQMHLHLGELCERARRFDEADTALATANSCAPHHPEVAARWSRLKRRRNELEGARAILDQVQLDAGTPVARYAYFKERAMVCDLAGDADLAWRALLDASMTCELLPRQADVDPAMLPATIEAFRTAALDGRLADACQSASAIADDSADLAPRIVFLIGPARSGTTMLGQIFDAHPHIRTLDERPMLMRTIYELAGALHMTPTELAMAAASFTPATIERGRAIYRRQLAQECARANVPADTPIIVDKNPGNLIYAPLINLFFPAAPIVALQRDPRDVCLSCFMQAFAMNNLTVHFATWPGTVKLYADMMAGWQAVRPCLTSNILDVTYEALVRSFEPEARRLLDQLGIPWHGDMMSFNEQARAVNTPSYADVTTRVYTRSVGRWQQYANRFEPCVEALAPFIDAYGANEDDIA
jgi:Flp pilus assembly protein TadD